MRLANGDTVPWTEIKSHFNNYYFSALAIWQRWRRFGLPFSGGWAEQPDYLVRLIEALDAAYKEYGNGGS